MTTTKPDAVSVLRDEINHTWNAMRAEMCNDPFVKMLYKQALAATAHVAAIQPAGEALDLLRICRPYVEYRMDTASVWDRSIARETAEPILAAIDRILTTPISAAPVTAATEQAQPTERSEVIPEAKGVVLQLLAEVFDAWENGDDCYEEGDQDGSYMGKAFRLNDDIFKRCCDLLNRENPPRNAAAYSDRDARTFRLALENLIANPAPTPMMPAKVFDEAARANREATDKAKAALEALAAPVPAAPADKGELPPLPAADKCIEGIYSSNFYYTDVSMHAYGQACILADHARLRVTVEDLEVLCKAQRGMLDVLRADRARQAAIAQPSGAKDWPYDRFDHDSAAPQPPASAVDICAEMRALCSACGGTGDVHSIDGEWRGSCDCEASTWSLASAPEVQAPPAVGESIGDDAGIAIFFPDFGVRTYSTDIVIQAGEAAQAYIDARSAASAKDADEATLTRVDILYVAVRCMSIATFGLFRGRIDAAIAATKAAK